MPYTDPKQDYPSLSTLASIPCIPYCDVKNLDVQTDTAQSLLNHDPNARPKYFHTALQEWVFVFTVMMATAATTFLQGVIIINTANIGRDMMMTPAQITWIAAAIGLSSGSFMLFFGKTADIFGRKLQLVCGMAFLSLFSLITAFAPSAIFVNILCGFLGLGTAIISPPAIGTMFATYPEGRRRNKAAGALGSGNPVGFLLGSMSSGIATKYWSWRASFIVISTFFFIMTILAFWTVPSIPRSGNTRLKIRQFDYLGTMLTTVGTALFSAGLTQGPEVGWKTPSVLVILVLGVLCLCGFGFWENFFTHPLLNPVVWRNKNFTLCVLCVMFGYMSFITNQFWISLYMQQVQKLAPLHIAVRLLPQALAGIFWSYVGQALTSKVNGTILMGIGGVAYLIGATLIIFIRQNTSYWRLLFPALIITVLGADFQFIISNLYVSKQMPKQSSLAAGVLQTAMRLSVALGLAISSAVYGSVSHSLQGQKDVNLLYSRTNLCSIIFAVIGLLFIPFMRIGTQGGKSPLSTSIQCSEESRARTGGEYLDDEPSDAEALDGQRLVGSQVSEDSLYSGSEESYFPRWSWEGEGEWLGTRGGRYKGAEVVYEVCIKCLEERRVMPASTDILDDNNNHYSKEVTHGALDSGHDRESSHQHGNYESSRHVEIYQDDCILGGWNSAHDRQNRDYRGNLRNDGIHGVWDNAGGLQTRIHTGYGQRESWGTHTNGMNPSRLRGWNSGVWNNDWNNDWYAQRGVREGGDNWV